MEEIANNIPDRGVHSLLNLETYIYQSLEEEPLYLDLSDTEKSKVLFQIKALIDRGEIHFLEQIEINSLNELAIQITTNALRSFNNDFYNTFN